jgi:recombinational DNA repair ATPase RecF
MIFKRLYLKNYRKFKEQEILFSPGINVVFGNNEAGKSTISQALLDVLYLDPTTSAKPTLARITSWKEQKLPYLELTLENNCVQYKLVKDFAKKEAIFINLDSEKETNNLEQISLILDELMGLPNKEIYQNTAFISQSEVAKIQTSRDFVNAIQNIATESSVEINVQDMLYDLEQELRKLRLGMDRHANDPGPLKAAMDKIGQLETELQHKKSLLAKIGDAAQSGESVDAQLLQVEQQIKQIEVLLNNYSVFEKANNRLTELDSQIKQIEAVLSHYNELSLKQQSLQAELGYFRPYINKDLDKATATLNNYIEVRKIANNELNKYSLVQDDGQDRMGDSNMLRVVTVVVALVLGGISYFLWSNILIGLLVLLGVIVVGMGIVFVVANSRSQAIKKQKRIIDQTIEQWKFKINDATKEIQRVLDEFQCEDVGGFFTNKAKFGVVNEGMKEIQARMSGVLTGKSIEDMRNQQLLLLSEKKEIEVNQITAEVRRSKISPQEYLVKSRELDSLLTERKRLEVMLTTAKVRREDGEVDADQISRLEEELDSARKALIVNQDREAVLTLTLNTIKEALKDTSHTINKVIAAEIEKDLPAITAGRYSRVRMDNNFAVQIFSNEKDDWVDPLLSLSKGTVDQIYLMLRLGFLKAILKNKSAPIICDDPFVTFDSERKEALHEVLIKSAEKFQIIVFTCDPEYDEWGTLNIIS